MSKFLTGWYNFITTHDLAANSLIFFFLVLFLLITVTSLFSIIYYTLNKKIFDRKYSSIPVLAALLIIITILQFYLFTDPLQEFAFAFVLYPFFIHLPCWASAMKKIPKDGNRQEKVLRLVAKTHMISIIILPLSALIFIMMFA